MMVVIISGLRRNLPILFGGSGWVDVLILHTLFVLPFYFIAFFSESRLYDTFKNVILWHIF